MFFLRYKAEYLVKDTPHDGARCAKEHIILHMRSSASTISDHNLSQPILTDLNQYSYFNT
jgi:hypothetical protein